MAIVVEGFVITMTVADNGNNRSTLQFECDPAVVTDLTTAETARLALESAYGDIGGSTIVAMAIRQNHFNNAIVLPAEGVQNEDKASISLQIAGENKVANLKIPAPLIGIFVSATWAQANVVDTDDVDLVTYCDQFAVAGPFMISDGQKSVVSSVGIISGKRISAKNNNG